MNDIITSDSVIADSTAPVIDPKEQDYVQKLTEWLLHIGYKKEEGDHVSTVALLGLAGEAGEVLDECGFPDEENFVFDFTCCALILDHEKKTIRQRSPGHTTWVVNSENFDVELSDSFYYQLALALNRGLTINDLARISYEKVTKRNIEKTPQ